MKKSPTPFARPKIGMTTMVQGKLCKITHVHPAGTVDVEAPDGKCFRVTGLPFL